eukprot:TRINITY_DN6438_c0_g2_i1.p1 TRINITY_DN6438_c0_g2~~TRINITY_DN6438_c0_g2_i1.p1  ORF type:complete len:689 (+),score=185.07 TRINITY_DN6438_c0_g2_i1:298-2364(+)
MVQHSGAQQDPQSATLRLLSQHRQARELLTRSSSVGGGGLWDDLGDEQLGGGSGTTASSGAAALPPKRLLARPQSASSLLGTKLAGTHGGQSRGTHASTSSASRRPRSATPALSSAVTAAARHFHAQALSGPGHTSAAASSAARAPRRPMSACASSGGSISPVGGRPASPGGGRELRVRPASAGSSLASSWYCPEAASLIRDRQQHAVQQAIRQHKEQFPLLPHQSDAQLGAANPGHGQPLSPTSPTSSRAGLPHGGSGAPPASFLGASQGTGTAGSSSSHPAAAELPSQGPPLLQSGSQTRIGALGKPPPPLPPLPAELEEERIATAAAAAVASPSGGHPVAACSGSLPTAELGSGSWEDFTQEELRLERESEETLSQLEVIDAVVQALRAKLEVERDNIESSKIELMQLRSAASSWVQAAEDGRKELLDREQRLEELLAVLPADDDPAQKDPAFALAASKREEQDGRQRELAAERLEVLEGQTARLEEQVSSQQGNLSQRMEDRQAAEAQVEALTQERDNHRRAQQEARTELRALEAQLKSREELLAASAQRRQDLERQAVRMRCEARGLRARLSSCAAGAASTEEETTMKPTAKEKATAVQISSAPKGSERNSAEGPGGPDPGSLEDARMVSLQLQHRIVDLWSAMKRRDEEIAEAQDLRRQRLEAQLLEQLQGNMQEEQETLPP